MILKPKWLTKMNPGHSLTKGVVGCWLFNDTPQPLGTAYDLSGNGNHGTLVGDTKSVAGRSGNALQFDGTGDYITIPNPPIILAYPFSIVTLVDPTQPGGVSGSVLSISDFSQNNVYFQIAYNTTVDIGWRCVARNTAYIDARHGSLSNGWDHVVGVQVSTSLRHLYVNGVLSDTNTVAVNFPGGLDAVTIGMLGRDSAYETDPFTGPIDHVLIYNRALSAGEVLSLYRDPFQMFRQQPIELWSAASPAAAGITIPLMSHHYTKNIGAA